MRFYISLSIGLVEGTNYQISLWPLTWRFGLNEGIQANTAGALMRHATLNLGPIQISAVRQA